MLGPNFSMYSLTLKFKPVYSYFSQVSQRHILFDAEDPPLLPIANKISMIEMVIIGVRAEIAGLDLVRSDPYVQVQVAGLPADVRDVRTPRISNCKNVAETAANPSWVGSTACWYYPVLMTFSWSEFAFIRLSLRTYDNSSGPQDSKRGRRGSLVQTFSSGSHIIGRRTLWAEAIKSGYRSVQLFTQANRLVATLLCHFQVKDARSNTFDVSERSKFYEHLFGFSSHEAATGGGIGAGGGGGVEETDVPDTV